MAVRDERVREYTVPTRIVWQRCLRDGERLLSVGPGQTTVWSRPGAFLGENGGVVIDFGTELHGGIQMLSGSTPENKVLHVRIRFGESVSEAMGEPNNDHAIHDTVMDIAPSGWNEYGSTGFRFIRIDLLNADCEMEIKEIRAVRLQRDLKYRGSFESSDERLNDIWRTGAYTTHLCLQDYVWDGIKRDRLVWMGDMHPEAMVAAAVFGRVEVVERSLDLARNESQLPKHMNGIGSYSLWWIITHRDWYRMHGALHYLREQQNYLCALLRAVMQTMVDAEGNEIMPGWRFLDWPTEGNENALHAGLQALIVIALEAGRDLCVALGEAGLAQECAQTAAKMRAKSPLPVASKQVNALAVLAGMSDPVQTNTQCLASDPFRGISTFYGYYVLQARAAAGDHQGCLDLIRRYWGGMLDLGATTFWEHFELDWMDSASRIDELPVPEKRDIHKDCGAYCFKGLRHSLCHGWASGPTAWLSEHVLGIRILQPGATCVSIEPHLGDLKWVRGNFPTPFGEIEVEHIVSAGKGLQSRLKIPPGISVVNAQ